MKDMKGTNIRKGTYLVWVDNQHILKVTRTVKNAVDWHISGWDRVIEFTVKYGDLNPTWLDETDMESVLVIPRRMVVPKLKLDQIKLYVALAGLEVTEEEEDE